MKKILSLVLALMMLFSVAAFADVEMSEPGVLPFVTETVELTVAIPQATMVLSYDDNYMTKMCEEDTGLDLVFQLLPGTETATAVDLLLASGDTLPDVFIYGFGSRTAGYGAEGYFQVLNDYFDKENGLAYCFWNEAAHMEEADYEEYFKRAKEADGSIYAFCFYTRGLGDRQRIAAHINRKFMDNLGITEKPSTKEEFYDYLVAVRDNDANGNGDPNDEIPLIGATWNGGDDEMIINMFTYYNPDYKLNVENDKVYAPFMTDEWREAMIYMNKLVSEGLMSDLTFSITGDELVSMVQSFDPDNQIIGVLLGMLVTSAPDGTNPCAMAYDWLGPVEGAYTPIRTANCTKLGYITSDCENPDLAFRFFDYWANERRSLITRYGEPGKSWLWRDDDPEYFDSYFVGPDQGCLVQGWEAKLGMIDGVVNPWVTENNEIWNIHMCCMLPAQTYGQWATRDEVMANSWEESQEIGSRSVHDNYIYAYMDAAWYGKLPDQLFTDPVYTVDELDQYNDIMTTCKSYVNETIASFALGQLDPNSDADWETYKNNMESAGLQQWLDLAQAYWDRSH